MSDDPNSYCISHAKGSKIFFPMEWYASYYKDTMPGDYMINVLHKIRWTRKHSSRMRTARLSTISRWIPGPVFRIGGERVPNPWIYPWGPMCGDGVSTNARHTYSLRSHVWGWVLIPWTYPPLLDIPTTARDLVPDIPPPLWTDTHPWKHHLPPTLLVGGNKKPK